MAKIWLLLNISAADEAAEDALFAINYLYMKQQDKGLDSNTRKFKYLKVRWFQK